MNTIFLQSIQKIKDNLLQTSFTRGGQFSSYSSEYHCDCSSLISSILKIENQKLFVEISKGKSNLKSSEYFDYAKSRKRYVQNIKNIELGDTLCWRKNNIPKSGDSGHMAIITSLPIKVVKNIFRVKVFDSTKTPHSNDSRSKDGVGEGDLDLYTNDDMNIIGIKWNQNIRKVKFTEILVIRF